MCRIFFVCFLLLYHAVKDDVRIGLITEIVGTQQEVLFHSEFLQRSHKHKGCFCLMVWLLRCTLSVSQM